VRFGIYFKQMIGVILSSTLALGMLAGIVLLICRQIRRSLVGIRTAAIDGPGFRRFVTAVIPDITFVIKTAPRLKHKLFFS